MKLTDYKTHACALRPGAGDTVYVVFDDCWEYLIVGDGDPPLGGNGLKELFHHLASAERTRGVGFFEIPFAEGDPDEAAEAILAELANWLSNADPSRECRYRFLIDYYRGDKLVKGHHIADHLPQFALAQSIRDYDYAFFTSGGAPQTLIATYPTPKQAKMTPFEKNRVKIDHIEDLKLRAWLGLET